MNTKHTPGPWQYAHGSTDLLVHDGDDVAYVDTLIPERSKAEQQANARLIAAAPDLLEALKAIVGKGIAGIPERFDDLTTMQMDVLVKAIWDGRAAIARATDTTNL